MSTSPIELPSIDEVELARTTDLLLDTFCKEKGIYRVGLSPEFIDLKREQAKTILAAQKEAGQTPNDPYKALYEAAQKELASAMAGLDAVRPGARLSQANDSKPPVTAEQARRRLGEASWQKLSDQGKLESMGQAYDPGNMPVIKRLFGRGADHHAASELIKINPRRYCDLREQARALNLDGN